MKESNKKEKRKQKTLKLKRNVEDRIAVVYELGVYT